MNIPDGEVNVVQRSDGELEKNAEVRAAVPVQPEAPPRESPVSLPTQPTPARTVPRVQFSDSTRALATTALVLGVVATAVTLYVSDTTVTVVEDGKPTEVRFLGTSVGRALSAAGVDAQPEDRITPDRHGNIRDGGVVTITHARPFTVTVGDETTVYRVTATTVGASLDAIGVKASDSALDKPRKTRVPLEGISVTMAAPVSVNVIADGSRSKWTTSSRKVSGVLHERGIRLGEDDIVTPRADERPVDGQEIRVVRVDSKQISRIETMPIPTEVVYRSDPTLQAGQTRVGSPGSTGHQRVTERITTHDGVATKTERLFQEVLSEPTPKTIYYGGERAPKGP